MGPGNSFMELIYQSEEFDYYALSDQDDVWLEDKLISALNILGIIYKTKNLHLESWILS